MAAEDGIIVGEDGVARCWWADSAPEYRAYHDTEWGFPVSDDIRLFEKLSLEGFQAGLSWLTILRKRPAFRQAFAGFDYERVATFDERDVDRLLGDAGIVRHRGKIEAVINNAGRAVELAQSEGSLAHYLWSFEPAERSGGAGPRRPGRAGAHGRLEGAGQGSQAARVALRRSDHGVRLHAGDGPGQRPPGRLRRPPARRRRPPAVRASVAAYEHANRTLYSEGAGARTVGTRLRSTSDMTGRALLRASDADREQVVERLRQAATEGRLHDDELEERMGAAFSARTYGELDKLVVDLPAPVPDRRRAPGATGRSPAVVAIALTVMVVLIAAVGSAVSGHGHGYHHWGGGLGPVIWLVWIAIGLRFFLHRRGRVR